MNDFRVKISQEDCRKLFDLFDENDDGELSIDEFLISIRGQLNDFRKALVKQVFDKLDRDHSGLIDYTDLKGVYNASNHPEVRSG